MRSFLFILIYVYSSFLLCEEIIIEGLLFKSIYDEPKGRSSTTSLTIPSKRTISYKKNLSIQFDIFLWKKSPFGFILSGGNDKIPNLFVLSYSDYRSNDTSYIELTYADRPSIISIPIIDNDQGWGKWKNIKLFFEKEKQRVGMSFQNHNIIWYNDIVIDDKIQFNFGSTSFDVEPPRMAIKNIVINRDDANSTLWKLNEETGEIAGAENKNGSSLYGNVINGVWIKELHRQLKPIFYHNIYQNNFQFLAVDDDLNQFIYLMNDSLFFYDNKKNQIVGKFSFPYLPDDDYIYKYNPVEKLIFATHGGGGGPVSYFDIKNENWENYVEEFESDGLYYTSNFVYDYLEQEIYTLGGYGWYEQKNFLHKYNSQDLSWDQIKYKTKDSNLFFPRCKASISYDKENDQYFLYGGEGNESGKQQQGFRALNDLWVIDLKNQEFNRIWEDSSQMYDPKDTHQKIAISSKDKKIYKIVGKEVLNENNSFIQTEALEILVSSFKSRNFKKFLIDPKEDKNTQIRFIHLQSLDFLNELLVIYEKNNLDGKSVVFSTVKTPLIAPHEQKTNYAKIFIISLIVSGILIFLLTTRLGSNDNKNSTTEDSFYSKKFVDNYAANKGLSVKLLNKFEIMKKGEVVGKNNWKSKKARDLFIFIILKGKNGASLDEIHNLFWPDVSLDSARNSRAVALSHIRKILSPYDTLLISDGEIIKFEINRDVYIDYNYMNNLIISPTKENFDAIFALELFDEGQLLKFSNASWVKPYRLELLQKIRRCFNDLAKICMEQRQWEKVLEIGNKLLLWDRFNDNGMRFSVLANKMLKKNNISQKIYTDYIKKYQLRVGENYPYSYNNILSSNEME